MIVSAVVKPHSLSIEAFLEWERQQETRHELLDGEIVAMSSTRAFIEIG